MVKTYCDKCGELIPAKEVYTVRTFNARNEIGFACYELCWACCQKLAELIDQAGKSEQAELEKPEAKKEPEEQEEEADPDDEKSEELMDWDWAKSHLDFMIHAYAEIGAPGWFGLSLMKPLKRRYEAGERTRELYDEIMRLE